MAAARACQHRNRACFQRHPRHARCTTENVRSQLSDIRRQCGRRLPLAVAAAVALFATPPPLQAPFAPAPAPSAEASAPERPPGVAPVVVRAEGIVVRVTQDGVPVADAEVVVSNGNSATRIVTHSNGEGIARFGEVASGPYEIWATQGARSSALVRRDTSTDGELELSLAPASIVRGQVTTHEGALGMAGRVELIPLDVDHAVRIAALDAAGTFVIAGVPSGRWRVEAHIADHVQVEDSVVVAHAPDITAAVRVVATGTVIGAVVDDRGVPVANATLMLRDAAATPLWPFELTTTTTRWVHPLAQARYLPGLSSARFGAARAGSRPAECGRGHCGVDLGSERGDIIHAIADGVIVALFPESRTEAGRVVTIHHGEGLQSMYMHLDELRPGLEVGHPVRAGDAIGTLGATGILRSAPHLHFAMTQEHAGRTWYVDPEPILRHAVVLATPRPFELFEPTVVNATLAAARVPARFTTDATGTFRIDGVAPGTYVAVAFAESLAPGTSTAIEVRSKQISTGVMIALSAGALVHGRVLGPDGAIANARVIASSGTGASLAKFASTTTNKSGEFTLRALSGKVMLSIDANGYSNGERTISIDDRLAGRARQREEFVLAIENAVLRGQLLAPDGGAAAGVYVRIIDGISRRATVADAQGRFDLSPVARGRYVLELTSRDYPSKRVTLESGRWSDVRLERGGSLQTLVRVNGDPVAGVRVVARGPTGQTIERVTDPRGSIELRALAPGAWALSARAAGYSAAFRDVVVRAGSAAPVAVHLELARAAALAGVVRDRFGQRVSGATVRIGTISTTSAADGSFRIDDAPSGTGLVEAERDTLRGSLSVHLAPGDERQALTIELR